MAGTRTVHRGARGRFAGAGSGKAERIRVGRGYSRAGTAANARPRSSSGSKIKQRGRQAKAIGFKAVHSRPAKVVGGTLQATAGGALIGTAVSSPHLGLGTRIIGVLAGTAHLERGTARVQVGVKGSRPAAARPKIQAGRKIKR